MNDNFLLKVKTAKNLYNSVKDLPIIDYHCHLSPKEIYEDKPFDNIGEMWLVGDHYKWRIMRAAGVDEQYITGNADYKEKFAAFIKSVEFAAYNPIYHWAQMELSIYFGIDLPLTGENCDKIWDRANEVIKKKQLSPRKLINMSKVEYICTTDDAVDSLEYHQQIKLDKGFGTKVVPTFRTDNLLLINKPDYSDYIKKLQAAAQTEITDLDSFQGAIVNRLEFFKANGCRFSDVGIPYFPNNIATKQKADDVFKAAISGNIITDEQLLEFLGYMYVFLGEQYKRFDMIMQWHLCVMRNVNSVLFEKAGADSGGDCIADAVSGKAIAVILDRINSKMGLPETIIYTLNHSVLSQLSSIAGSFPKVIIGAAWWYNDHIEGIEQVIKTVAQTGYLGSFLGMLTDSRSFLSYARFDYFRRILCNVIGEWVNSGEYDKSSAEKLLKKICYYNIKELKS